MLKGIKAMIGIRWKREQGPADLLLRLMLEEADMEKCYPHSRLHKSYIKQRKKDGYRSPIRL